MSTTRSRASAGRCRRCSGCATPKETHSSSSSPCRSFQRARPTALRRTRPLFGALESRFRSFGHVGGADRMSKVVVINHLTLDGVMQSPGRAEEDTRDGFTHGGWSSRNADDQVVSATYARVEEGGGLQLLLGRRSYEGMLGYWNTQDSPFKEGLNAAPKYVASRTLAEPLPWPNSTLLHGDVTEAVAELKHQLAGDLTVMGSGELIQTLRGQDL